MRVLSAVSKYEAVDPFSEGTFVDGGAKGGLKAATASRTSVLAERAAPKGLSNLLAVSVVANTVCLRAPVVDVCLKGVLEILGALDDYTRCVWVKGLASKSDVPSAFKEYKAMCENSVGRSIKGIMSDNGGEFMSGQFQAYLKKEGIVHYTTVPYSPSSNGVAERMIQTLGGGARAMLHTAGFPKNFWYYVISMMTYTRNRCPTRANDYRTPFECWYGRVPDLTNLRIFGSPVSVAVPKEKRGKWDERSHIYYLVGHEPYHGGYRVWDPVAKKELKARDVIFHEDVIPPIAVTKVEEVKENEVSAPVDDDVKSIKVEPLTIKLPGRLAPAARDPPPVPQNTPAGSPELDEQDPPAAAVVPFLDVVPDFPGHTSRSGLSRATAAVAFETALFAGQMPSFDVAFSVVSGKPLTLEQAMALDGEEGQGWRDGADREWKNLADHGVYEWVEVKKGDKPISCGTVLQEKKVDGKLVERKVRAVAHGYRQIEGVHYNDTYAAVMRLESLRTMLAIGAIKGVAMGQFDVKSAYLHGTMKERVLMRPPAGFPIPDDKKDMVWLLLRPLYGTKQGGHEWQDELKKFQGEPLGISRNTHK